MVTKDVFENLETFLHHTTSPRPDKIHIGVVQLSTDHTLEMDWAKLINESSLFFSSRVYYSSVLTPNDLNAIAERLSEAAGLIATGLPMDVMAFGCTSASLSIGSEKIGQLLTKHHPGLPTTNPWAAAKAAFRHLGCNKITVYSPYPTDVNYPLYRELLEEGFEVPAIGALRIKNDTDITSVSFKSMVEGLEHLLDRGQTDVIFMSCTNLRVLQHIEEIEALFGIPVVCSNQAMFWHAMVLAGETPQCPGYGKLLNPPTGWMSN